MIAQMLGHAHEEVFVTELIAAAVVVVILGFIDRAHVRPTLDYAWRGMRVAVPIVALVVAVPAAVQFLGPNRTSGAAIHSPDIFLTDAFNLILPTQIQWLAPAPLEHLTLTSPVTPPSGTDTSACRCSPYF